MDTTTNTREDMPRTQAICRYVTVREMLGWFVVANIACIVVFAVVRMILMSADQDTTDKNDVHFTDTLPGRRAIHPQWDAIYLSVMTQSTVGASAIVPLSNVARLLTVAQCIFAIGSVLVVAVLVSTQTRRVAAMNMKMEIK